MFNNITNKAIKDIFMSWYFKTVNTASSHKDC